MAKNKDEAVEARVLVAGEYGGVSAKVNDVISLPAEIAKEYAGSVDADPAAVAYAKSLVA